MCVFVTEDYPKAIELLSSYLLLRHTTSSNTSNPMENIINKQKEINSNKGNIKRKKKVDISGYFLLARAYYLNDDFQAAIETYNLLLDISDSLNKQQKRALEEQMIQLSDIMNSSRKTYE